MNPPYDIARDDFDTLCRLQRLKLTPEEADLLFEAFLKLKPMLNRIPAADDLTGEPAFVWAPAGTKLSR